MKDKPYTLNDLALRMRDYSDLAKELADAKAKVDGQRAILASHERNVETIQERLDKVKVQVQLVLKDLDVG